MYKLNGGSGRCHAVVIVASLPDPLHIRKITQKSKFLLSQTLKWEKIIFFIIPEMLSKTFVMERLQSQSSYRCTVLSVTLWPGPRAGDTPPAATPPPRLYRGVAPPGTAGTPRSKPMNWRK